MVVKRHKAFGAANFLRHIVREGLARHAARRKPYAIYNDGVSGLGIWAVRPIATGEIIFKGEERSQRIATRRWVDENWDADDRRTFSQYAYPLCDEVYILWSDDPRDWAPQNHSCAPNTGYSGLNVVALHDIAPGEELTFDYATVYSEAAEPFECHCGAPNCRGFVRGTAGNSVELREKQRRRATRIDAAE